MRDKIMQIKKANLFAALSRAQANYDVAHKTGYNPHYKNTFSTFEDLVSASRKALTQEGISVIQYIDTKDDTDYFVTTLAHESEEYISGYARIHLKDKTDIQKLGSVISYLKRYMYAAICGIVTTDQDDDGNDVVVEPVITDKQVGLLKALIKDDKELENTICKHYNVQSLGQILSRNMNQIVEKLKSRNQ
jgi:ribosomal protein L17